MQIRDLTDKKRGKNLGAATNLGWRSMVRVSNRRRSALNKERGKVVLVVAEDLNSCWASGYGRSKKRDQYTMHE